MTDAGYTVEDIPALRARLELATKAWAEDARMNPSTKHMDGLQLIIGLLDRGCGRVEATDRGLLVNGKFLVGPRAWSVVGRSKCKWYPWRSLSALVEKLGLGSKQVNGAGAVLQMLCKCSSETTKTQRSCGFRSKKGSENNDGRMPPARRGREVKLEVNPRPPQVSVT